MGGSRANDAEKQNKSEEQDTGNKSKVAEPARSIAWNNNCSCYQELLAAHR
jgi:hypothetical protein